MDARFCVSLRSCVLLVAVCIGLEGLRAQPAGYPTYAANFSTDASSTRAGYSGPGLLPAFSLPGGDILGQFLGRGRVVPPMTCNRPAVICPAGPVGIGMGFPLPAHAVEVDAYSTGDDWDGPAEPWTILFSVDRRSRGFSLPRPLPAATWSEVALESAANDAAADLFVSGAFIRVVQTGNLRYLVVGTIGWNYLGFDGDGIQAAPLPAMAPTGIGLVEPSPPGGGDNLDGTDSFMKTFRFHTVGMTSPHYQPPWFPPAGVPVLGTGSKLEKGLFLSLGPGSARAYGVSPADILCTNSGGPPWVWASAAQLGLHPVTDDIDALAMWVAPGLAPVEPGMTYRGVGAVITFSVTPQSSIVGAIDPLWGIPIMPGDILTPGDWLGYPGQTAILVPSGGLGLWPMLQRPPGVFADNVDALQGYSTPLCDPEFLEWIEWDAFPLCGGASEWLPPGAAGEWDRFELPASVDLPIGPLDPTIAEVEVEGGEFRRADANADGEVDVSDPVATLDFLFLGGGPLECAKAVDANDDGGLDLSDAVYSLAFLFLGGSAPPAPFDACGSDPTPDALECVVYPPCG